MDPALAAALGAAVGAAVTTSRPLSGGDNAGSHLVQLDDGRTVFAKSQPSGPPGCLTTEAIGLRWLAETDAVPVPRVIAVSDGDPTAGVVVGRRGGRPG